MVVGLLFRVYDIVWHLCEIVFINKESICEMLCDWFTNFPITLDCSEIINFEGGADAHPKYWSLVHTYALRGRYSELLDLLSMNKRSMLRSYKVVMVCVCLCLMVGFCKE